MIISNEQLEAIRNVTPGLHTISEVKALFDLIDQLRQPWTDIEREFESQDGIDSQRLVRALCKRANGHRKQVQGLESNIAVRDATICEMDDELDAIKEELAKLRVKWLTRSPATDTCLVADAERIESELSKDGLHGAAQLIPRLLHALRDAQAELAELRKPVVDPECDSVLAEILRSLRIACPAWAYVDVDTRNELISKWRKLMERKPVAVQGNESVERIRAEASRQYDHVANKDNLLAVLSAYDALAQECAGYANAHTILMGERDAARRRESLKDQIIASKDRGLLEYEERQSQLLAEIAGLRERLESLQTQLRSYPADWRKDSSLKTWFPITEMMLEQGQERERQLIEQLSKAESHGRLHSELIDSIEKQLGIATDEEQQTIGYRISALKERERQLREVHEHAAVIKDLMHTAFSGLKGGFTLPDWWLPKVRAAIVKWDALVRPHDQHVRDTSDLLDYGYAPGNYTSHCITCDQTMESVDKRCRCCMQCAINKRDAALSQRQEQQT